MKLLWQLFLTFFKLGAFTFGGGYAMISLIENEVVSKKGWLTRDEMLDIITIAESTPGPLAINMATFVGTKVKGFVGALIATIGLVLPPFVIIIAITLLLNEFRDIVLIDYALRGIQAGVVVLIFNAFIKFFKGMDKNILSYIFLVIAFLVALFTDFSVVLIILIGALSGVLIMLISSFIAKKKSAKLGCANSENSDTSNEVTPIDDTQNIGDNMASSDDDNENVDDNINSCDSDNTSSSIDSEDIEESVSVDDEDKVEALSDEGEKEDRT